LIGIVTTKPSEKGRLSSPTGPMPARPRLEPPSIRQASFNDYERIATLETAVGLIPRSRERWLHLWRNNPAYQLIPDWPIGWVLEDRGGRIVGSIGNIPSLYHLNGRKYLGAVFVGWAVDPQYRAHSLMLVTHKLQHPKVDLELVTTAGPMPQAVFTRLGWSRVPVGRWDQAAFWITNYAGALEVYLEGKMPGFVSKAVGSLLRGPLILTESLTVRKRDFKVGYGLEWRTGFDETFDRFWTELLESRPALFLNSRARETMRWHFQHSLERNDAWILTACDGPRLVGYAILHRKDARSMDLTRMMLADFQTLGRDAGLSSAMISCALDRCRRERIHVLENLGCWIEELQPVVNRPSNYHPLESWCYLYKPINQELTQALQIAASWYPTLYDGDSSL
jgi:hypothetical protein